MFMIRTDIGAKIGSGHFVRCQAIAKCLQSFGVEPFFAVSDEASLRAVRAAGFVGEAIGGSPMSYTLQDALVLSELANGMDVRGLLVDSYGVSRPFFRRLKHLTNCEIAYIDDLYLHESGLQESPFCYDVDLIINYGFGFDDIDYRPVYASRQTRCLIGPLYAPVRTCFSNRRSWISPTVNRVLLTSGATNPNDALGRMLDGCECLDEVGEIGVVVGKDASVDGSLGRRHNVVFYEGLSDLSSLMCESDVVVSSGGSTLYELACLGVPTIALPVVENQIGNVGGFFERGLGLASLGLDWCPADLEAMLIRLVSDWNMRKTFSARMRETVDGGGASRIASNLLGLGVGSR